MSFSNVLKLLSVMFMVGISGVQGAVDMTHIELPIHSSQVESNMYGLSVGVSQVNVALYQFNQPVSIARIPLHMIIGGRLTQSEIMEKLSEGAIFVVHKNEGNHYALYFKRSKSETTGFHLGTYDNVHASARMVSAGSCCEGGIPNHRRPLPPTFPEYK